MKIIAVDSWYGAVLQNLKPIFDVTPPVSYRWMEFKDVKSFGDGLSALLGDRKLEVLEIVGHGDTNGSACITAGTVDAFVTELHALPGFDRASTVIYCSSCYSGIVRPPFKEPAIAKLLAERALCTVYGSNNQVCGTVAEVDRAQNNDSCFTSDISNCGEARRNPVANNVVYHPDCWLRFKGQAPLFAVNPREKSQQAFFKMKITRPIARLFGGAVALSDELSLELATLMNNDLQGTGLSNSALDRLKAPASFEMKVGGRLVNLEFFPDDSVVRYIPQTSKNQRPHLWKVSRRWCEIINSLYQLPCSPDSPTPPSDG